MFAAPLPTGYALVLAVWAVLLACAIGILAVIAVIARPGRRRRAPPDAGMWQDGRPLSPTEPGTGPRPGGRSAQVRPTRAECAHLMAEAAQLDQLALAAIAGADRAAVEAARARAAATETARVREEAWQSIEAAQQALVAVEPHDSAAADTAIDPDVSRAAFGAYRRGDISVDELQGVLRRSSGWDPAQDQQEHEAVSLRAAERAAHRRYYSAAAAERSARNAAGIAEVAARALAEEATEAIADARSSRRAADECFARASASKRRTRPR